MEKTVDRYQPHTIEPKWQAQWQQRRVYEVDLDRAQRPFFNLMMFPYPSAEGLHVGNVFAYTGADVFGRYQAMHGFDVFEPMGFDAFGIHSENFAIQRGEHPATLTARNVERFRAQLRAIGNRFAWDQQVETTSPAYYRWTQWIFVQLFKAGLAVRKKAAVNWCPSDRTVLADEQVVDGRCERCDATVESRELDQWFLRITAFKDRLLENLDDLDWSSVVKTAQRHWLGGLRDWLISRQRYWGTPIPIVYCSACGIVAVPEDQLPVRLPPMTDWTPRATGSSPLADVPEFVNTTCPACGGPARRETDVADNFLDSAWYFLRYASADFDDRALDAARTEKWLPVHMYVGGAEHSVLHLLYSRFICMALHDLGHVPFEEPFTRLRSNGLLTQHGAKMSKSRGNVTNPDDYIQRYGADTLRMYLLFLGPFEQGGEFVDRGIGGVQRFLQRVWRLMLAPRAVHQPTQDERKHLHRLIARVDQDIAALRYNTAIAALMAYVNRQAALSEEAADVLPRLLAPFAPHLAEELWSRLGRAFSVHQQAFPVAEARLIAVATRRVAVQVNGKTRGVVELATDASESEALAAARGLAAVRPHLTDTARVVYRPGRVLNVVV
ncbi:MAG TPA: class I tRNA ligase family protein [Chloroflexota bacterium]